jgi:hypothetical protein
MKRHRGTITSLIATLVAISALPATAEAGSLLSGYGGPGQGNQAILGSSLIGGPSGGGGAGGGGSGGATLAAPAAAGTAGAVQAPSGSIAAGHAPATKRASGHAGSAAPESAAPLHRPATGSALVASADSRTLGISGTDLLYILLGLGGLLVAGALTRHVGRDPR